MVDGNESIIARLMMITGNIESRGRVILEGTFEGSFSGQNLDIRETGKIVGDIQATNIDCSGHIEGSVVTDSLILRRTGRHVGTVETRELAVEPGAILDCALQSGEMKRSAPAENIVETAASPLVDLGLLLTAFQEGVRPCCMDIPWSERLDLYSQLMELLEKGKPLVKVTGEPGSGKSQFVNKLRSSLPASYEVLTVHDRGGSVAAVLQEVAVALAVEGVAGASQGELLDRIKDVLLERWKSGQRVILLVDNAEKMYPATMEGIIRTLTNAYSEGDAAGMLQLILFGTKEMESKMVATTIEYFDDETNCQLHLEPLNIKDTADYLRFCLQLVAAGSGCYSTALLPYETIRKIHAMSRGNIGAINRLADKALRRAYGANASEVSANFL
ncbi:MAG: polymer-forming cytoskeletal protein [Pseudomonadota bacterium]